MAITMQISKGNGEGGGQTARYQSIEPFREDQRRSSSEQYGIRYAIWSSHV